MHQDLDGLALADDVLGALLLRLHTLGQFLVTAEDGTTDFSTSHPHYPITQNTSGHDEHL